MSLDPSRLKDLIEAELATLTRVSQTLADEHDALVGGDAETLERATAAKAAAIEAHSAQQQERLQLMAASGYSAETPLSEVVQAIAVEDSDLGAARDRLAELADACQSANRRNGGLIIRLQERARSALDVLRREENNDLYSLSGAKEHRSDSRSLGKA